MASTTQDTTIQRMLDWRVLNPTKPWSEFAETYGVSLATVYKCANTEMFTLGLSNRQAAISEAIDNAAKQKAGLMMDKAFDNVLDALDGPVHPDTALKAISVADKILGISSRQQAPRPVAVVVNARILADARSRINGSPRVGGQDTPAIIDGHSERLSLREAELHNDGEEKYRGPIRAAV